MKRRGERCPPLSPRRRVPSPQARLEANVTALGTEVLALRRERAELARGKAALQGELHPAGAAAWGAGPPSSPRSSGSPGGPPALWATPGRTGWGLGCAGDPRCPLRAAEELAQGKEKALGLRQRLEAAVEQQRALRVRGEQCEARQKELEATL